MQTFETALVAGGKAPYTSWTFVIFPEDVVRSWGSSGPWPVRGSLRGQGFRGTASRGEGVVRMPVVAELRERAAVQQGDRVVVEVELDPEPRPVVLPVELEEVLGADPELARAYQEMAPSHRRAWAAYVGEAKREATRRRRAEKAIAGIRGRRFPNERP